MDGQRHQMIEKIEIEVHINFLSEVGIQKPFYGPHALVIEDNEKLHNNQDVQEMNVLSRKRIINEDFDDPRWQKVYRRPDDHHDDRRPNERRVRPRKRKITFKL